MNPGMPGRFITLVRRLAESGRLSSAGEYRELLDPDVAADDLETLRQEARRLADRVFGRGVYVRALVEITNRCRNNCLYCGIRRDNRALERYALTPGQILDCCATAYAAGMRTFVLQGGENPDFTCDSVCAVVKAIHGRWPDAAVTLSLGEWPDAAYEAFFRAGASRYLLRQETVDALHYGKLHPPGMSRDNRLRCQASLKRIGFQTGAGIMVGSPWQTLDNIAADLAYMAELGPHMIGIGPFIPHSATPLGSFPPGSVPLTLRLISILRLMFPGANIPATTALATLDPEGRRKGILAGANVVMPNVSPSHVRESYALYDGKSHSGAEAVEGLAALAHELGGIGFEINFERGDFKNI